MRIRIALAAAPLLALGLAACGAGADTSTEAGKTPAKNAPAAQQQPVEAEVKIVESSFGPILADQANRTLYAFAKDKGGSSACSADCLATWPALTSAKPATPGAGTDTALLASIPASEGSTQARYGEWPLYYYAGDVAAGDVNGQGVDGEWFVVKPDGKLIRTGV